MGNLLYFIFLIWKIYCNEYTIVTNEDYMTVCYCHVMYVFQSESTLCSGLNVKEHLAWNRHDIWSLSDSNGIWTHNHLVHKWKLNHSAKFAKWLSCVVSTYLDGAFLTVCYYHVTYAFQSESTCYSCMNVKELLAGKRHNI